MEEEDDENGEKKVPPPTGRDGNEASAMAVSMSNRVYGDVGRMMTLSVRLLFLSRLDRPSKMEADVCDSHKACIRGVRCAR